MSLTLKKWIKSTEYSLGSVDGFGIEVALCIHWRLFLQCWSRTGIHKVWRQSSSDGTQAWLDHFEKFSIIFLQERWTRMRRVTNWASHIYLATRWSREKSRREKYEEATWKTPSWRSLHQAIACHKLINDSSALVWLQLLCSQALY